LPGASDKSPQSGVVQSTELIVRGTVARMPITLRGTLGEGGLESMSGTVTIDRPLSSLIGELRSAFGEPVGLLEELVGDGSRVSLKRLSFGYDAAGQQRLVQLALTITAGASGCDLVVLKTLDESGGFIAGLELRSEKTPLEPNPLRGLIGDLAIGGFGIHYASKAYNGLRYYPLEAFQDAASLVPFPSEVKGRDFRQGLSFSAEIMVGGTHLLEKLASVAPHEPPAQGTGTAAAAAASTPSRGAPALGGSTMWLEVGKTLGPLTVRRIGLSYRAPDIGIRLDAGLRLAVLTLNLEGLGLDFPLAQLTADPKNVWKHLRFNLDGAAVTFEQGPLTISGGLLKVSDAPLQLDGTLLVRTELMSISALGSYADMDGTPSFFVFAALQKALGGPPYFFVMGLAFGFGVNRALKLPPIDQVQNFPLIRAATDPDYLGRDLDLRAVSAALGDYVCPSRGNFWVAAGVKFTSFGMIDSFALVSVSFGTQLEFALLGLSRIVVPKQPPGVSVLPVIARAEMAIKVAFTPESGLLSCEARLTENSFVLRSDFRLRGGFAFYSWFAGPHEGDFVVSIGGYHPKFQVEPHYPRPDAVSFDCRIGDVTLQGHCYFALCPSAVMAGGGLCIVYQSGGIKAWFIAQADFLVQWKPVYYDIAIGVSIGVALNLKIAFVRVRLSLELSAALALHGPPLGGTVRISLYVVSFTVRFGESKRVPPPLTWESRDPEKSFAKSFLPHPEVTAAPPKPRVTTASITAGLIREIGEGDDAVRLVNPHQLVLSSRTLVPVTDLRFNGGPPRNGGEPLVVPRPRVNGRETDLGVRSMGKAKFYSRLDVSCEPVGASERAKQYLAQYLELAIVTKSVPLALWGAPVSLVTPPREHLIDDAPVGIEIRTRPGPRPWETPALDLAVLAYDRYRKHFAPTITRPRAALPAFGDLTISGTIRDQTVIERRSRILEAMAATGRRIAKPDEIDLRRLAHSAPFMFQAMPAMARVGQYPPRGYLE
jgi:hypothetical protein